MFILITIVDFKFEAATSCIINEAQSKTILNSLLEVNILGKITSQYTQNVLSHLSKVINFVATGLCICTSVGKCTW